MDHKEAIREMMTEKYLLDELSAETRESFEEHFFDCADCAEDVKAGALLIQHSRAVFSAPPMTDPVAGAARQDHRRSEGRAGWWAWFRPAFAVPVFAVLLAVIGYQNLIQYPRLRETVADINEPQILGSVHLKSVRAESIPSIEVRHSEPFLLFLDVPADADYKSYKAELYNPAGALEWTLAIPGEATKDTLSIRVPAKVGGDGVHTLVLYGLSSAADKATELRRYRFQLDQK